MGKVFLTASLAGVLGALPVSPALAARWSGQAFSLQSDFRYGKVSFTTSGSTMRNLKIEGVTTSGCGGYKSVIVPKLKIKGGKFSANYIPFPGLNDRIIVRGSIKGSRASGVFAEGPIDVGKAPVCQNSGRFTARRG